MSDAAVVSTPKAPVFGVQRIAFVVALGFSAFHLYTGAVGAPPAMQYRSLHLLFAAVLVFLLKPSAPGKRWGVPLDVGLALLSLAALGYVAQQADALDARAGDYTAMDFGVGLVIILLVLEGTRRLIGWGLPAIAIGFLAYAYVGPHLPGGLAHSGYSLSRIVSSTSLFTEGIFGPALGVSANFVFLFILLAAFVNRSGAGTLIMDASFAIFGSFRGGPAKMAVAASSLFGTISGSAVANTGAVGPFTIPLMKRVGFEPRFAAAIEASSGVGGQIMPPVLGAAAFIMADFLRIPYWQIAVAAIVPAALYYLTLFIVVHIHSVDMRIEGLSRDKLPKLQLVVRAGWMYLIPPVVLVYMLGVEGASAAKAALFTIGAVFLVSQIDRRGRIGTSKFVEALQAGAVGALEVAFATACAGIIVGMFTLTGLGLKFSDLLIALTDGSLVLLLVATMLASLVLGAGLPSVPTYLLLAIIVAPAIVKLGVSPLAAHMFIFYYGALADLTPPLAVSAYIAAGIAGSDPLRTSVTATRLAVAGFVIPFLFVRNEAMLIRGAAIPDIAWAIALGLVAVVTLAALVEGRFVRRLRVFERLVLLLVAVAIVVPGFGNRGLELGAIGVLVALGLWQWRFGLRDDERAARRHIS